MAGFKPGQGTNVATQKGHPLWMPFLMKSLRFQDGSPNRASMVPVATLW